MIITFLSISVLLNIILLVNLLLKRSKRIKFEKEKKKRLRTTEEIDIAISEKAAELLKDADEKSGIPESTNYGIHGYDVDFINNQANPDNTFSPANTEPIEVKEPEPDESDIAIVRDYIEIPNKKEIEEEYGAKRVFGKTVSTEESANIAQAATEILEAVDKKEKDIAKKKPGRKKKVEEKPVEAKKTNGKAKATAKKTKKAGK